MSLLLRVNPGTKLIEVIQYVEGTPIEIKYLETPSNPEALSCYHRHITEYEKQKPLDPTKLMLIKSNLPLTEIKRITPPTSSGADEL